MKKIAILLVIIGILSVPSMAIECGELCEELVQTPGSDPDPPDNGDDATDDDTSDQDTPDQGDGTTDGDDTSGDDTDDDSDTDEDAEEPVTISDESKQYFHQIREAYVYLKILYVEQDSIIALDLYEDALDGMSSTLTGFEFEFVEAEFETCSSNIDDVEELSETEIMDIFSEWEILNLQDYNDSDINFLEYFNEGNKLMECVFDKYSQEFSDVLELDDRDETELSIDLSDDAVFRIVSRLDRYSTFLNNDNQGTRIGGLSTGGFYSYDSNQVIVTYVINDSPAWNSGLRKDDVIISINDINIDSFLQVYLQAFRNANLGNSRLDEIINDSLDVLGGDESAEKLESLHIFINNFFLIGTPPNTVSVGLEDDSEIIIEFTEFLQPDVFYMVLDENKGYVYIESFGINTDTELKNAVDDLLSQGVEGLIIDLRNNPGGRVITTVNSVALFLEEDATIVSIVYNDDSMSIHSNLNQDITTPITPIPIATIVNSRSASGSEVFSAALQDYERSPIIGEITYGKGSANILLDLNSGSSIYITIGRWFSPDGHSIENTGIQPDIEINFVDDNLPPYWYVNPIPNEHQDQIFMVLDQAIVEFENEISTPTESTSSSSGSSRSRSSSGGSSSGSGGSPTNEPLNNLTENIFVEETEDVSENKDDKKTKLEVNENTETRNNSAPVIVLNSIAEIADGTVQIIGFIFTSIFNIFRI